MELLELFVTTVTSGLAWDGIKNSTLLSVQWLKTQLTEQNFPVELSSSQLEALVAELQNAPSSAKSDTLAFAEYLNSHHVAPIISKNLQQINTQKVNNQINIGGNNSGTVVGGNVKGGIKIR